MPRILPIFLVLILASYGLESKVFTIPVTTEYIDDNNAVDSAIKYHSDPNNLGLGYGNEEFEINTVPRVNKIFLITMWFPQDGQIYDRRFMLDTNSSRMAAPVRNCYDCLIDSSKVPKPFHNWSEQNITLAFPHSTTDGKICKISLAPKKDVPWYFAEDIDIAGK